MSNNGDDFEDRIVARINAHTDTLIAMAKADNDERRANIALALYRIREDLRAHTEGHA